MKTINHKDFHKFLILFLFFAVFFHCFNCFGYDEDNQYVDGVTGFSLTVPDSFKKNRYVFPPVYQSKKEGKKKDYIIIDKIYKDITPDKAFSLFKESMEKHVKKFKVNEKSDLQIKNHEAKIISYSYEEKREEGEVTSYILFLKDGSIINVVEFIYSILKEDDAKKVFDSIVSSIRFETPTKIVHNFFSPKLYEINKLAEDKKFDEAETLVSTEILYNPDDAGLYFLKGEILAKLKKDKEAVTNFIEAFDKGYCDFSEFFKDEDLNRLVINKMLDGLLENKKEILKKGREFLVKRIRKELASYYEIKIPESNLILFTDIKNNVAINILKDSALTTIRFAKEDLNIKIPPYPILWIMSDNREINKAMIGNLMGTSTYIGGVYLPSYGIFFADKKTGYGTFVHEFMHALHSGDENFSNQHHPRWISEMLSTIYETLKMDEATDKIVVVEGSGRVYPLIKAIKDKKMIPLSKIM